MYAKKKKIHNNKTSTANVQSKSVIVRSDQLPVLGNKTEQLLLLLHCYFTSTVNI